MPDTAIVTALKSLLPSLPATNKPFPPLLISQCESLLALSRQRASHLKLEEEIARAHACAEIACTRLRVQLRLPAIKNGAGVPCQPKVYAKLVKFLEGSLGDAAGSLTPSGRKRDATGNYKNTPASGASGRKSLGGTPRLTQSDIDGTPTKKRATAKELDHEFVGKIKKTRNTKAHHQVVGTDDKAPTFVMPSIRKLCKILSTPALTPHVYTGTCIVLGKANIWTFGDDVDDDMKVDILSLVVALYLMVLTRMREEEMTTDIYTKVTTKIAEAFELDDEGIEQVEEWISRLNEEGWCVGEDWFESVPEAVLTHDPESSLANSVQPMEIEEGLTRTATGKSKRLALDETDPEGVLLPGLGTMLYDSIDWTNKDRCMDYTDWHSGIMARLNTTVKAGGGKNSRIWAVN